LPYAHRIVSDPKSNQYNTSLKYHIHYKGYNKTITLQLVSFRFFDNIKALLDGFDFTACQFGFDGQTLYTGDTSLDDLRNREIIFNNVLDNVATGIHIEKYTKIGFKIPASQRQRYDEIMIKTNQYLSNKCPEPSRSDTILSRWSSVLSSSPSPVADSPRPVAVDEDYAYPRPVSGGGIDLSRITQMPAPSRPSTIEPSFYSRMTLGSNPCVDSGSATSPVSPGVSTREVDSSAAAEFDAYFSAPTTPTLSSALTTEEVASLASLAGAPVIPMDFVTSNTDVGGETLSQAIRREVDNEIVQHIQQTITNQTFQALADGYPSVYSSNAVTENPLLP
jgi:hypothetical protein